MFLSFIWMILLGLTILLVRWFNVQSPIWLDLQLRRMVLWISLLGGILATENNRHIRIDLIDQYLNLNLKPIIRLILDIISGISSLFLGFLSISFLKIERLYNKQLNDFLFGITISEWITELIIPVCFFLMAFYFLTSFTSNIKSKPTE